MIHFNKEGYQMQRMDELINLLKSNEWMGKKEPAKEEKKSNPILWVFAILGGIAVIAGIAYALYKYFTPDYLEDFEDDFDDEFDDEFFEEDEEDEEEISDNEDKAESEKKDSVKEADKE
ncbi:MAG: DUF4366 domain-containing protein [Lachnospiraceae bacterium]|nr:DUF4366 domain-containing protein [Lachnospiraceae bacterium]